MCNGWFTVQPKLWWQFLHGCLNAHQPQLAQQITAAGGDESPLGNQDMSSLVDLGSSYLVIREMDIVPVSRRQMMQVAGVACLPGVPLLFLALPVMDVIRLLLGVVV